jgi:O-antigen/teichoic acid export membrane protein
MGVVCGFLAAPIGALLKSPGVIIGLWMIIPGLLFFALNKVLINVLNGLSQMRAYAAFRSLRYVFIPISIVVIILLKMPDSYIALSLTITEILLFFGLVIYINIRLFPLWGTSNRQAWFSEHISFGIRGALSGILIELNTRVDVLMLGYFSTDAVVGIYSFVSTLAEGFGQIPFAVRWNVDPILGKYFSEGTVEKISELAKKIRRLFYPLMGVMGVAVILLYPVGYALLVKDSSLVISWITFSIIMIGVIINSGYRPFTGILLQGGRPGAYTLFYVGLVLNDALLNLFFIPYYGIYGAAGVTALTYVLEAVVLVIMARKLFNVRL